MAAFWQEQQKMGVLLTMDNLIKEQFDRLEKIDLNAYHLLCRIGCFRYQDVLTVPLKGLFCLLWDVAENQQGQVVNALKNRSLVDVINGEYQLHPLIREEAISRLRNSEDWETANRQAAEFWTDSVKIVEKIDDALMAFEAYYHYLFINAYEEAGCVIIKGRDNKWEKLEHLGRAFYRLGLLSQMINSIQYLTPKFDKIDKNLTLSRLYNILGDLYWLLGNPRKAINYHKLSGDIADKHLDSENVETQFWSKRLKKKFFFNTGLCYLNLFELEKSKKFLEETLSYFNLKGTYKDGYYKNETLAVLAFLNSCFLLEQKNIEKSYELAHSACTVISISNLDSWAKGYLPLFLGMMYRNFADIKNSSRMYKDAIEYSEESHFTQVKAKALTGLGELYRIQKDYDTALDHHFQSIKILDEIGAKCDLAEAYFQLALTYQAMGDQPNSQTYFDKALDLWGPEQIDAPKQIERVRKAMQTNP